MLEDSDSKAAFDRCHHRHLKVALADPQGPSQDDRDPPPPPGLALVLPSTLLVPIPGALRKLESRQQRPSGVTDGG